MTSTPNRAPYRGRYLRALVGVAAVAILLLLFAVRSDNGRGLVAAGLVLVAVLPLGAAARLTTDAIDIAAPPWRELGLLLLAIALVVGGLVLYGS